VVLFNGFKKYLAAFFFVMFYASASLATTNNLNLWSDTIVQTIHPTIKTSYNSEYFNEYFTNFRSVAIVLERKDMPVGSMSECFEEASAITLHKDGDKVIWSLVPSLDRVSLNPIDNIKNLQVLLKYRF
jgi:hypothetical protein